MMHSKYIDFQHHNIHMFPYIQQIVNLQDNQAKTNSSKKKLFMKFDFTNTKNIKTQHSINHSHVCKSKAKRIFHYTKISIYWYWLNSSTPFHFLLHYMTHSQSRNMEGVKNKFNLLYFKGFGTKCFPIFIPQFRVFFCRRRIKKNLWYSDIQRQTGIYQFFGIIRIGYS